MSQKGERVTRGLHRLVDLLWRATLRPTTDCRFFLGHIQKSAILASFPADLLWEREQLTRKVWSLARHHWEPEPERLQEAAREVLIRERFGGPDDFGPELLSLMVAHGRRAWDFAHLKEQDLRKADALFVHGANAQSRLSRLETQPPLNLRFGLRGFELVGLVFPMAVKVPVVSLRYFVDLHAHFAFNEIRKASHPNADDIIGYLYEVLFVQQKTAIALGAYLRHAHQVGQDKGERVLVGAEVDSIMNADSVFAYLKASVEKTVALVAAVHGIDGLENRKTQKQRLALLHQGLDKEVKTPYGEQLLELISSENLKELNAWRSGLLHKKGIADLQPHRYVGVAAKELPFLRVFEVMHEQHVKNAAVLLGALAMLTDRLVVMSPPDLTEQITHPNPRRTEPPRRFLELVAEMQSRASNSAMARRRSHE